MRDLRCLLPFGRGLTVLAESRGSAAGNFSLDADGVQRVFVEVVGAGHVRRLTLERL